MKKYTISILIFLACFEVFLRLTGIYKVYPEKIGGQYSSYWDHRHQGHYKIMPPNQVMRYEQKEFTLEFPTNNLGMRNAEVEWMPAGDAFRILCLGDSYTEGDGAAFGYSYPRQLESILNEHWQGGYVEVINAGKNGSDIIYAEKFYREVLADLRPDLVLMTINDSDIEDIIQRGGYGRFLDDGSTKYRPGPWYENLYAKSHVFRFIIHVPLMKNKLFLGPRAFRKEKQKALDIIEKSMELLQSDCQNYHAQLRFVIQPLPWELDPGRNPSARKLRDDPEAFYNKTSALSGLDFPSRTHVYNLYPGMLEAVGGLDYTEYAWPLNGHFNSNGYQLLAGEIVRKMAADDRLYFPGYRPSN